MTFRVLTDENVEHWDGHDVVHVDLASEVGKGTDDHRIAQHSWRVTG